ncbi:MAG: hypothetical protein GY737_00050 [Desulfobacteraceae bacterium]|nr:hypothetical protein [Desulfobacteraceae bacterium]
MTMSDGYNGWANYETWNVALWIGNDEGLYNDAKRCSNYTDFRLRMNEWFREYDEREDGSAPEILFCTPDGVAWNDPSLDTDALDEMIKELGE